MECLQVDMMETPKPKGDRGGMQELINIIKKSQSPIICICNDRSSPKVKSLAGYCVDIKFRKPTVQQVVSFSLY